MINLALTPDYASLKIGSTIKICQKNGLIVQGQLTDVRKAKETTMPGFGVNCMDIVQTVSPYKSISRGRYTDKKTATIYFQNIHSYKFI